MDAAAERLHQEDSATPPPMESPGDWRGLGDLCVESLLSMGFSRAVALEAWERSGGDLATAVEEAIFLRQSPPDPSSPQRRSSLVAMPRAQLPFTGSGSPLEERRHSQIPSRQGTEIASASSTPVYGHAAERLEPEGELTVDDILQMELGHMKEAGSEGDSYPGEAPTIEDIMDVIQQEAESLDLEDRHASPRSLMMSEHASRTLAIQELLYSVQEKAYPDLHQRAQQDAAASVPHQQLVEGLTRSESWENLKQDQRIGSVVTGQDVLRASAARVVLDDAGCRESWKGHGGYCAESEVPNVEDIIDAVLSSERGGIKSEDGVISVDEIIRSMLSSPETAEDEECPPDETEARPSVEDILRSLLINDHEAKGSSDDGALASPTRTSAPVQLHNVQWATRHGQEASSTAMRAPMHAGQSHSTAQAPSAPHEVSSRHGHSGLPRRPQEPSTPPPFPSLGSRGASRHVAPESPQTPGRQEGLGMRVADKAGVGVIVTMMRKGGAAAAAEPFLQIGDRIISMDGNPVRTAADVALHGAGEFGTDVLLHCSRISGRTDAPAKSRVVSIISLVRGKPGEQTVKLYTRLEDGASLSDTQSWINAKSMDSLSHRPNSPPRVSWSAASQSIGSPMRETESSGAGDGFLAPRIERSISKTNDFLGAAAPLPEARVAREEEEDVLSTLAMLENLNGGENNQSPSQSGASPSLDVVSSWEAISSPQSGRATSGHAAQIRVIDEWDRDLGRNGVRSWNRSGAIARDSQQVSPQKPAQNPQGPAKALLSASAFSSSRLGPLGSADRVLGTLQETEGTNRDLDLSRRFRRAGEEGIPFSDLTLMWPPMGTGSCKTVYQAQWRKQVVAAALVRHGEVGTEERVLRKLPAHPFLPVFFGVSRDDRGNNWLITEFFPLGGLDTQLEVWEGWLSTEVKLCIVQQILEAMVEIHKLGIIHRDLASRNVLVHSLHAQSVGAVWVKVTDFGSAKEGTTSVRGEEGEFIPWRWVSPEVHTGGVWSEASDVWAFGVTCWEVFSAALIPFCEISDDGELKRRVFQEGMRLQMPSGCPEWVYSVMGKCWAHNAFGRPSFSELKLLLQENPAPSITL